MFYVGDKIVAQTSIDEVVHSLLKNFIRLEPSKGRDRGQLLLKYILNSISRSKLYKLSETSIRFNL